MTICIGYHVETSAKKAAFQRECLIIIVFPSYFAFTSKSKRELVSVDDLSIPPDAGARCP
jgi:hypothetical protein